MKRWLPIAALVLGGFFSGALLGAEPLPEGTRGDDDKNEAFRDIGAVLAWRLAPPTLEAQCRALDPDGAEARRKSLETWLAKNDALIKQVDRRIAEVVPILFEAERSADPVRAVQEQVKKMLLESLTKDVCIAERNPHSTSWTSNGVPHVPGSLAALYDWKVRHSPR